MVAVISCSIEDKNFTTKFPISKTIPEYMIADEAYRLAIIFAQTQYIAKFGYLSSNHDFGIFLKNLDYNYKIEEEK